MYTENLTNMYVEAYKDVPKVQYVATASTTDFSREDRRDIILVNSGNNVNAYMVGEGPKPVGQCCFIERNSFIEIASANVSQDFRHRGVGSAMVAMINEIARIREAMFITLDSKREAYAFWSKLGFTTAGLQTCDMGALITMDRDVYQTCPLKTFEENENYVAPVKTPTSKRRVVEKIEQQ